MLDSRILGRVRQIRLGDVHHSIPRLNIAVFGDHHSGSTAFDDVEILLGSTEVGRRKVVVQALDKIVYAPIQSIDVHLNVPTVKSQVSHCVLCVTQPLISQIQRATAGQPGVLKHHA